MPVTDIDASAADKVSDRNRKRKGTGYGTDNFSWTAALFIDAVMDELAEA